MSGIGPALLILLLKNRGKLNVICSWLPNRIRHTCEECDELAVTAKQPDPVHIVKCHFNHCTKYEAPLISPANK